MKRAKAVRIHSYGGPEALVDAGKVKPVVETVLPLSETRRAQELSERGHVQGKIVLKVA